jgi:hypothetical protein
VSIVWQGFATSLWNFPKADLGDPNYLILPSPLVAPATSNFRDGLLSPNGEERSETPFLRDALIDYAANGVLPPQPTKIDTIVDWGVTSGKHYFELWGTFPNPTWAYSAFAVCDGTARTTTVEYQNPNGLQINVSIPDPGANGCNGGRPNGVYCTFRVILPGTLGSPDFGPQHICPGPTNNDGVDWGGRCDLGLGGC